ncbi:thioesterase family protein [Paraburkholderia kururiensis]|uniref:thioesterase family protein n=1 Tax=Paraburkholderia kururiensis TaxID=984307 RepID=UPI001F348BC2|nr:thioesterase family protein [Paraburkholderia kururiensis]
MLPIESAIAMSLLLRLLTTLLFSARRGPLNVLDTCVTPFRVWLNDLDVLRHMTNSRYFAILDLARVDLMIRSGLFKRLNARGWYPVVTLETLRFHRSLELGERYEVATRVIGWDEKNIFLEQGFVRDGAQVALGVVRARFLKRSGGTVSTAELMELAGITQPSPPLPEWVRQWSAAEGGMAVNQAAAREDEETDAAFKDV